MVNKHKITGEKSFNGDQLGTEGNQELNNNEKTLFLSILADLWPTVFSLDREKRIFTFFKHCLDFAIFKPLPVGFASEK